MIYKFIKAEKELFAVYQTVYSESDVEMWFDWNARLNDTKETDESYFLYQDDVRIGGAIIIPNLLVYGFIIPPFNDRQLFWKLALNEVLSKSDKVISLGGVLDKDVDILLSFGAEIKRKRKIMVRPTDKFEISLDERYSLEEIKDEDIESLANSFRKSFVGSISYKAFGEETIEQITSGIKSNLELFKATSSLKQSVKLIDKSTNEIVGGCIAGIYPNMVNQFGFISDIFCIPSYRGKGLGECILKHSLNEAYKSTKLVKLHILKGNPAERLYIKMGFISGPTFTDMIYDKNVF